MGTKHTVDEVFCDAKCGEAVKDVVVTTREISRPTPLGPFPTPIVHYDLPPGWTVSQLMPRAPHVALAGVIPAAGQPQVIRVELDFRKDSMQTIADKTMTAQTAVLCPKCSPAPRIDPRS